MGWMVPCCLQGKVDATPSAPVTVAGVWIRVSLRRILAFGPRLALASAAVSICSILPTCTVAGGWLHMLITYVEGLTMLNALVVHLGMLPAARNATKAADRCVALN